MSILETLSGEQAQNQEQNKQQSKTSSQPQVSLLRKAIKGLLLLSVPAIGAVFLLKGKGEEAEEVETVSNPIKKGSELVDPETGETLIVTKKGGRKKKVITPDQQDEIST